MIPSQTIHDRVMPMDMFNQLAEEARSETKTMDMMRAVLLGHDYEEPERLPSFEPERKSKDHQQEMFFYNSTYEGEEEETENEGGNDNGD